MTTEQIVIGIICVFILFFSFRAAGIFCISGCGQNTCGNDDCGRSCGKCDDYHTCQAGQCVKKNTCGRSQCGYDKYGNSCGTCFSDQICENNRCILPPTPPGPHFDNGTISICPEDSSAGLLKWHIDLAEGTVKNNKDLYFQLSIFGIDDNYQSHLDADQIINAELYDNVGTVFYYRNTDEIPYDPRRDSNTLVLKTYSSKYDTFSNSGDECALDTTTC